MRPLLLLLLACGTPDEDATAALDVDPDTDERPDAGLAPNVLLVLLDDVGVDHVGAYGLAPDAPPTPVIDGLAAEGVLFRWAYASPSCSPARAAILTGRHGRRTGIGNTVFVGSGYELNRGELGLGELVAASPHGYTSSFVGKWHLADAKRPDAPSHPASMGFDWYAGSLENLVVASDPDFGPRDYWRWEKNDNGELAPIEAYATTHVTDLAIERIHAMPEPWLLFVAYHAAHSPWHVPPAELHSQDLDPDATLAHKFDAMVESVDTELGRLLAALPADVRARTTVIVVSDNGTPDRVVTSPLDPTRAKTTVYEGGVRVPLVVSGPQVARAGESHAFVHAVDLFTTVAELASVPLSGPGAPAFAGPLDGISLLPYLADPSAPSLRSRAFAEAFLPLGRGPKYQQQLMLHDGTWKLMVRIRGDEQWERLFKLEPGALDEGPDLLGMGVDALSPEVRAAYDRLSVELDEYVRVLREDGR